MLAEIVRLYQIKRLANECFVQLNILAVLRLNRFQESYLLWGANNLFREN